VLFAETVYSLWKLDVSVDLKALVKRL